MIVEWMPVPAEAVSVQGQVLEAFLYKKQGNDAKIAVRCIWLLTHREVRSRLLPRGYVRNRPLRADIAQLVEQRIRNAKVVGSTPIIGTIHLKKLPVISINHVLLLCRICDIAVYSRFDFAV